MRETLRTTGRKTHTDPLTNKWNPNKLCPIFPHFKCYSIRPIGQHLYLDSTIFLILSKTEQSLTSREENEDLLINGMCALVCLRENKWVISLGKGHSSVCGRQGLGIRQVVTGHVCLNSRLCAKCAWTSRVCVFDRDCCSLQPSMHVIVCLLLYWPSRRTKSSAAQMLFYKE